MGLGFEFFTNNLMELCQEHNCEKTAKVVCSCNSMVFCNKHSVSHTRMSGAHNLDFLRIQISQEVREKVISKLIKIFDSINTTLHDIQAATQKTVAKIYHDLSTVQNELHTLQYQHLSAIRSLNKSTKVYRKTDNFYESLLILSQENHEEAFKALQEPRIAFSLSETQNYFTLSNASSYLPNTSIQKKTELIKHLHQLNHKIMIYKYANYIKSDSPTLETLLEIIKDSAHNPEYSIPASRALTILSKLGFDFSNQNLRGISVPGAEITEGIYKHTDFSDSNLSNSKLNLSVLAPAILNFKVLSSISQGQKTFKGHSSSITCLKFSHDNTLLLSAGHDKTIRIWETQTGYCRIIMDQHLEAVLSIDISRSSNEILTGSADSTVRLWDRNTGIIKNIFTEHKEAVNSVTFLNNDLYIASASEDKTVLVMSKTGDVIARYSNTAPICCLAVSGRVCEDNSWNVLWGNCKGDIKMWKIGGNKVLWDRTSAHECRIVGLGISRKNRYVISAGINGVVRIWASYKGKKIAKNVGRLPIIIQEIDTKGGIKCFKILGSFKVFLTVTEGNKMKMWKRKSGEVIGEAENNKEVLYAELSAHGYHIAYDNGNDIEVRDIHEVFSAEQISKELNR